MLQQLHLGEPRTSGRRLFVEQQLFLMPWRQDKVAVEALKVARNAFFRDRLFDLGDCRSMTLGGKACPSFPMEPFNLGVPIIDDVREMGGGSPCFPAANEAVFEHDD